jgi:hypothetical protein
MSHRQQNERDLHPASSHRSPSEIAEDEAGPIGHDQPRPSLTANNGPVEKINESQKKKTSSRQSEVKRATDPGPA